MANYSRRRRDEYNISEDLKRLGYKTSSRLALRRLEDYASQHKAVFEGLKDQVDLLDKSYDHREITEREYNKLHGDLIKNFKELSEGRLKRPGLFRKKTSLHTLVEEHFKIAAAILLFLLGLNSLSKTTGLTGAFVSGLGNTDIFIGFLFLAAGTLMLFWMRE